MVISLGVGIGVAELIAGMFNASSYKRSQGRIARQLTLAAMVLAVLVGAVKLSVLNQGSNLGEYVIPVIVFAIGSWASWRIVNIPRFADFLISVEAEMNKVSWPARSELWRASMVVIVVIFFLAGLLYVYDIILKALFNKII
ncbi:MAG: preprotein translocase subunit SecE [Pirellulales bacterium]|nr:preprotein translocase subunit SecE [Pirellulales bacterium]